jgi:BMFP domain-containing protein YqiC
MNTPIPPAFQNLFNDAQAAFEKLLTAAPAQEARTKADALMQQTLAKLGAVPRAEFDIQRDMLLALRERVTQLEQQLEQALAPQAHKTQNKPAGPQANQTVQGQ